MVDRPIRHLYARLHKRHYWPSSIVAFTVVVPMSATGFETCHALRANNYFSGSQFGAASAGVI
jgi:hypothetical protein